MNKVTFELASPDGHDSYKLLSGLVIPRPIGWIGTVASDGSYNLAPFSFFNVVSTSPPIVLFSAGSHPDRPKDTGTHAEESGEFTVNLVSRDLGPAMNLSSGSFGAGEDEFAICGLTAVPGTAVRAPMVGESPANLECRVVDVIALGPEKRTRMVLGEVVAIHVVEDALDGSRVDPAVIDVIGRLSGSSYTTTRDRFEMERPG